MAIRQLQIGSLEDIHQYDDADFDAALVTDHTVKVGTAPIAGEDVLRLDDVGFSVGDVVGPAAATDEAIARFDGITGKLIQNSLATLNDAGTLNIPAGQEFTVGGAARGDVFGPAASTDNAIARYDALTGKLIQDSGLLLDDNDNLSKADDLEIGCGANKTLVLVQSVWDDIQFPISSGRVPAANFPDYDVFTTNTRAYKFDVDDYIDLEAEEMLHWWKEGTNIYPHVHVALDGANATGASRYVKFTVYLAYADENAVYTETNKDIEIEIPDGTADMTHLFGQATAIDFSGITIGTQVICRLERIAATSGTEYANHIFVTQVGIHVEKDTMGSRQVGTK